MKMRLAIVLAMLLALAAPLMASAQVTTYTSGFQIQNLDPSTTANVTIDYYDQSGTKVNSVPVDIAANSSKTFYPLKDVSSGFNGSVAITSNTQIAAIANVLGNGGKVGAAYDGISAGNTTINLPLVMKAVYGATTWYNVQNTGNSDATVNVTYAPGTCKDSAVIKPGASHTFDQSANACLPAGFVGAAKIDSGSVPVAATVMQVAVNLMAYNGFTSASTAPIMPLVSSGVYGSGTGIQVQNTGGTDTNVTLTYTPSAGYPGKTCTETRPVKAGQSATFAFNNDPVNRGRMPAGCYTVGTGTGSLGGFIGSAKVTANSAAMPLVAIVNQVSAGVASADSYASFDASQATSKISLPLIMDRNYGSFTGIAVANVGTQATDVKCTFTGTSYSVTQTVQPGASMTTVQGGKIADKYVGSAVCTATGGDAKIVAVVNEALAGAPVDTDGLFVYQGINY